MEIVRRRLHGIARLAFVAVLALALLPTLSRAMAAADAAGPWAEICSSTGVKPLTDPTPTQAAGHLDHCPLCTLQNALPALPVVETAGDVPDAGSAALLPQADAPPRTSHAWRPAAPRGPPASS